MTPIRPPRFLASRFGIVAATVAGFAIGAAGFAAAQHGDPAPAAASSDDVSTTSQVSTTIDDGPTVTIDDDRPAVTIDLTIPDPVDDGPSTTVDDGPTVTIDDDRPAVTIDLTVPDPVGDGPGTTIDDGPGTTIDDGPSTTIAAGLPAPFTTSYSSAGGSINVTWNGTAFTLDAVSPATGFRAEIEDQAWDRVRVDFEGDDVDARIEVRINDGQLRVRID